ncbi:MAG TPA: GDYXXLXY domain-containing protein [Hyphomicrobiaceae bacterium]|nr:GDYXXLXY domain-containing protein [Hyphomicrobiaceae bacterium]
MGSEFGRRVPGAQTASPVSDLIAATRGRDDASNLARWWRGAVQLAASLLIGFGIILWIAANWDDIPKFYRFAIVGGALALMVLAAFLARIRVPALVGAFLAAGGLFALIGQTYQTGADPWQLFAVWAVLTLPWALAARHDLLWCCWVVVALVALVLWHATYAGGFMSSRNLGVTLSVWALATVIAVMLSPWSLIRQWIGESSWAFRIAYVLAGSIILQGALSGAFAGRSIGSAYFLGLIALGGAAAALYALKPFEFFLLALTALGIDALLITGLARGILVASRWDMGSTLFIGLMAAAIVSGTGSLLVRIARQNASEVPGVGQLSQSMWPVALLSGFGALLAAIPLISFLGFIVSGLLMRGPGTYIVGAAVLAAGCYAIRSGSQTSFLHQLGVIGLVVGLLLLGFGVYRDLGSHGAIASLIMAAITMGLAAVIGRTWVQAILGMATAIFIGAFAVQLGISDGRASPFRYLRFATGLIATLASAAIVLPVIAKDFAAPIATALEHFREFIGGWAAAALLASILLAGPTFLIGGALGWRAPVTGTPVIGTTSLATLNVGSALLAAIGVGLLHAFRPWMRTILGIGAAVIAVIMAAVIDGLGGLILLGACAILAGRTAISIGAVIGSAWVIGAFYYWLGWPLIDKAKFMFAAGILLAAIAWVSGLVHAPKRLAFPHVEARRSAAPLIAAGAVAIAALAGHSVWSKEAIITTGRQIYLALAPVDPRSLMQGDYMALRFVLPSAKELRERPEPGSVLYAVARLDDRGVAEIARVSDAYPSLAAGEVAILLRAKGGHWIVSTDAWYFKEGTGKKWEAARFGVFRVGSDGTALLINLVDKDLQAIKPEIK